MLRKGGQFLVHYWQQQQKCLVQFFQVKEIFMLCMLQLFTEDKETYLSIFKISIRFVFLFISFLFFFLFMTGCYQRTPLFICLCGTDEEQTKVRPRNLHLAKLLIERGVNINHRVPTVCIFVCVANICCHRKCSS